MNTNLKVDAVAVKTSPEEAAIMERLLRATGSNLRVQGVPSLNQEVQVIESHKYEPVGRGQVEAPLPAPPTYEGQGEVAQINDGCAEKPFVAPPTFE